MEPSSLTRIELWTPLSGVLATGPSGKSLCYTFWQKGNLRQQAYIGTQALWQAGERAQGWYHSLLPAFPAPAPAFPSARRNETRPRMGMPAPPVQSYLGTPSTCSLPLGPRQEDSHQDASKCCGHCEGPWTPIFAQKLGTGGSVHLLSTELGETTSCLAGFFCHYHIRRTPASSARPWRSWQGQEGRGPAFKQPVKATLNPS